MDILEGANGAAVVREPALDINRAGLLLTDISMLSFRFRGQLFKLRALEQYSMEPDPSLDGQVKD
jgi:hypothetical protein